MPSPLHPKLTPEEQLQQVAALLARGVRRMLAHWQQKAESTSRIESPAPTVGHPLARGRKNAEISRPGP